MPRDSSVGRAEDCSEPEINLRSLGRWFDSGSREGTIPFCSIILTYVFGPHVITIESVGVGDPVIKSDRV